MDHQAFQGTGEEVPGPEAVQSHRGRIQAVAGAGRGCRSDFLSDRGGSEGVPKRNHVPGEAKAFAAAEVELAPLQG